MIKIDKIPGSTYTPQTTDYFTNTDSYIGPKFKEPLKSDAFEYQQPEPATEEPVAQAETAKEETQEKPAEETKVAENKEAEQPDEAEKPTTSPASKYPSGAKSLLAALGVTQSGDPDGDITQALSAANYLLTQPGQKERAQSLIQKLSSI